MSNPLNGEKKCFVDRLWDEWGMREFPIQTQQRVLTAIDALIAAVEREALEMAFGIGGFYVEPVFMGGVPGWEKGGAYYDGYVKGATDYREGIRALIESKRGDDLA